MCYEKTTFNFIEQNYPDLSKWIKKEYTNPEQFCDIRKDHESININLYSLEKKYSISAYLKENYIGLIYTKRNSLKGGDLSDGQYSESLWHKILDDIFPDKIIPLAEVLELQD